MSLSVCLCVCPCFSPAHTTSTTEEENHCLVAPQSSSTDSLPSQSEKKCHTLVKSVKATALVETGGPQPNCLHTMAACFMSQTVESALRGKGIGWPTITCPAQTSCPSSTSSSSLYSHRLSLSTHSQKVRGRSTCTVTTLG